MKGGFGGVYRVRECVRLKEAPLGFCELVVHVSRLAPTAEVCFHSKHVQNFPRLFILHLHIRRLLFFVCFLEKRFDKL